MAQVEGDGSVLVPQIVSEAPAGERIAVIFDGEKRRAAYATYRKVCTRVRRALGAPCPLIRCRVVLYTAHHPFVPNQRARTRP